MEKTIPEKRKSIFFIELLRTIAAFAVVLIHVLGPFRKLYGQISESDWLAAAGINSATRWAVPVFMMLSGALLLSSKKPFNCKYYLSRRLAKVVIPFIAWTVIYAIITGWENGGWYLATTLEVLKNSPNNPAWYHIWFFYDFIPLYFVIPFFALFLKRTDDETLKLLLFSFTVLFTMKWLGVNTFLAQNLILYTGYLFLGWYLFNRDNSKEVKYWIFAGVSMLLLNFFGTWYIARETGKYSSFFMGYKTLNTAIIGGMLFVCAQTWGEKVPTSARGLISTISKYSFGIYLLHPILLIPIRNLDNGYYQMFGSNWIAIPAISLIIMGISLVITIFLAKVPVLNKLVP